MVPAASKHIASTLQGFAVFRIAGDASTFESARGVLVMPVCTRHHVLFTMRDKGSHAIGHGNAGLHLGGPKREDVDNSYLSPL